MGVRATEEIFLRVTAGNKLRAEEEDANGSDVEERVGGARWGPDEDAGRKLEVPVGRAPLPGESQKLCEHVEESSPGPGIAATGWPSVTGRRPW